MSPAEWNPGVRRVVYIVLTIAGLAHGAALAYLGGSGDPVPAWLIGAGAAYGFLAAATGLMAARSTPHSREAQDAQHQVDAARPWPPDPAYPDRPDRPVPDDMWAEAHADPAELDGYAVDTGGLSTLDRRDGLTDEAEREAFGRPDDNPRRKAD